MWHLRQHRHLKPEVLSEYLDSRLGAAAEDRVAQRLTSCAVCREELESLRATVTLLRQLPVSTPVRSFTMAAPPGPQTAYPPLLLRLPQWVYAGAGAVAVLALAVLVSADSTGLLAPGTEPVSQSSSPAAVADQERSASAAPRDQTTVTQIGQRPDMVGKPAAPPPASAAPAALAVTPEPRPAVAPAVAPEPPPAIAPSPVPLASEALAAKSGPRAPAGPAGPAAEDRSPAAEPVLASATASSETVSAATSDRQQLDGQPSGRTSLVWRVLEGVASALALLFLVGLMLKRHYSLGNRRA